jgi:NADPH:quinone reductase-like Zn-dependent oxidoreductase
MLCHINFQGVDSESDWMRKFGAPFGVCKGIEADDSASPQSNEVLVAFEASSISPADLLMVRDEYPGPNIFPARQGIKGVALIITFGSDVEDYIVGDRVFYSCVETELKSCLLC